MADLVKQATGGTSPSVTALSARPSECGRYCVLAMVVNGSEVRVELDRNETHQLAITLNCMAAGLKEASNG